jgi:Tol biopolymer transport system component
LDERHVLSRFSSDPEAARFPVWSPDGQTIVFGRNGLYRKAVHGSGEEQILGELASAVRRTWTTALSPMDWSRDGRLILFRDTSPETNIDLWVLPVTPEGKPVPGTKPTPYLRTPFNETSGRFSPEPIPHWVAYQADGTGRYEIYIASFPEPKMRLQITSGGGTQPQWSGDGGELYYTSADGKLMAVGLTLQGGSLQASTPRQLLQVNRSSYQVAPDGKRILVYQREPNSDPLDLAWISTEPMPPKI